MQTIQCPLCDSKESRRVLSDWGYDGKNYYVVSCDECGFMYLNPQPNEAELSAIYSGYYGQSNQPEITEKALKFRKPVFESVCRQLEPYKKSKHSLLLDMGCGNGDFLMLAKESGWQVKGIEYAGPAAEFAQLQRNLDVINGSLEELPFADQSFDAVTILDVLEHVRNPRRTMDEIHRVLNPGGALVIRVPNTPFQILKSKVQKLQHGEKITTLATPLHLNHFDALHLKGLVGRAGFHIKNIESGAADGEGIKLLVKKTYVSLAQMISHTLGVQCGNILSVVAEK